MSANPFFGRRSIQRLPTFTLTEDQRQELRRRSGINQVAEFSEWFEELIRIAKFKQKNYQSELQPVEIKENIESFAGLADEFYNRLAMLDPVVRSQLEQLQCARLPEEPVKNPLPLPLARLIVDAKVMRDAARIAAEKFRPGRGTRGDDLGRWLAGKIISKFGKLGYRPTSTADGSTVRTLKFALELLEGDSPDDKLQDRAQNRVRETLRP